MNGCEEREDRARVFGVLSISIAAHVFFFVALGFAPSTSEALKTRSLEFEVVEPRAPRAEPAAPDPKAAAPEEPLKEPAPRPKFKPVVSAPLEQPVNPEEPPPQNQAPPPVEFPGVTLTADGAGLSWSTVVGSGAPLQGPVVVPRKARQPAPPGPIGPARGAGNANGSGAVKDLSHPPRPPGNMDELLTKYYPERARSQGIEGQAVLRVRIDADGKVGDLRVIRETFAEFGSACMEHLKNTRWAPAQDRLGRAVAFDITYTCRFEVGY